MVKISGSAMKPHLITSARPATGVGRQRCQQIKITDHTDRLVEAADEVLAFRGVDAGLAPDSRVNHAQQGGRNHDHSHSPQPGRCHEPSKIGGGTAAEADHAVGAGETGVSENRPQRSATATLFAASASGTSIRTGSRPAVASVCDSRRS